MGEAYRRGDTPLAAFYAREISEVTGADATTLLRSYSSSTEPDELMEVQRLIIERLAGLAKPGGASTAQALVEGGG